MDTYRIRVDGTFVDGTWGDYDMAIYRAAVLHNGRGAGLTEVVKSCMWETTHDESKWGNEVVYKIESKA